MLLQKIWHKKENEFVLQKEEVERVKYFSIEELENFKKNNDQNFTFYKWKQEGFDSQMKVLKKERINQLYSNNLESTNNKNK